MTVAMHYSSLISFLNGDLSSEELWGEIEREVADCDAVCAKGGAGSVILTAGPPVHISQGQVAVLIGALAQAKLPMDAASYIADAIIMSDDFGWEDEGIEEALSRLSDQSAPLTADDLEWAMTRVASNF